MSQKLYCPECSSYLMAGDGECHDCSCGWKQEPDEPEPEHWLGTELKEMEAEQPTLLQRYQSYWIKNHHLPHHEIDCPNPECDERLNVRRPAIGSGEMWDSLAECPYCNGVFFYESRPRRIDVSFKGKLERIPDGN